jgi:tripartite-type tricarboxylate transporter receptor subunit TctC
VLKLVRILGAKVASGWGEGLQWEEAMPTKRHFLTAAAGGILAVRPVLRAFGQGSEYPTKDIRIVIGSPPGGGADIMTRYFASKLRSSADCNVLVINKPGASGNLAAGEVARSNPDGHTLLLHTGLATLQYLYKSPGYNSDTDFTTVATLLSGGYILIVRADSPISSVQDLIVRIKQKGDSFYGAVSAPTIAAAEALKSLTNIRTTRVDYRNSPDTVNDLRSGHIDFMFADPPFAAAQGRAGNVKLLAVTSKDRMKWAPNLPTVREAGFPSFDFTSWMAVYAPIKTPKLVILKLHDWLDTIVQSDETRKFLLNVGCDPLSTPLDEMYRFNETERGKWTAALKAAKVEPQ